MGQLYSFIPRKTAMYSATLSDLRDLVFGWQRAPLACHGARDKAKDVAVAVLTLIQRCVDSGRGELRLCPLAWPLFEAFYHYRPPFGGPGWLCEGCAGHLLARGAPQASCQACADHPSICSGTMLARFGSHVELVAVLVDTHTHTWGRTSQEDTARTAPRNGVQVDRSSGSWSA